ncbi:hypothetical protein CYMTET_39014 [Cymbomonas tetramitiformis]|uniref:Response regulatory domain-containing protein n=1 Tax=Cymbomonas tetramitiformis TaxID=36881 RepID=A0AAE0CCE5_9CHLO|nr:hypothetical protein CYMTET_39014 [Cymbomonas tetramitiformis]
MAALIEAPRASLTNPSSIDLKTSQAPGLDFPRIADVSISGDSSWRAGNSPVDNTPVLETGKLRRRSTLETSMNTSILQMDAYNGQLVSLWHYTGGCQLNTVPVQRLLSWRFNGTHLEVTGLTSQVSSGEYVVSLVRVQDDSPDGLDTYRGFMFFPKAGWRFPAELTLLSGSALQPTCGGHGVCQVAETTEDSQVIPLETLESCHCDNGYYSTHRNLVEECTYGDVSAAVRYVRPGSDDSGLGSFTDPYGNILYAIEQTTPRANISQIGVEDIRVLSLLPGLYFATTNPMVYIPAVSSVNSITSTNGSDVTILDCQKQARGFIMDSARFTLIGLTLRNCWTPLPNETVLPPSSLCEADLVQGCEFWESCGGAISINRGKSVYLKDMQFESNFASLVGSVVCVNFASVERNTLPTTIDVEDSVFHNNTCRYGGGVFATSHDFSSLSLKRSTFTNNQAVYGGVVFVNVPGDNVEIEIDGCRFEGNWAAIGGAVFVTSGAQVSIRQSMFDSNRAWPSPDFLDQMPWVPPLINNPDDVDLTTGIAQNFGLGGALELRESHLEVTDTHFMNCSGSRGAAVSLKGMPRRGINYEPNLMNRVTFTNNSAAVRGAALYVSELSLVVLQSTCLGNGAAIGGAILAHGSDTVVSVMHTSFVDNYATVHGGATAVEDDAIMELNGVIVTSNSGEYYAGGLYCGDESSVNIDASLFTENSVGVAGNGGAIALAQSCRMAVMSTQLLRNTAGISGGAVYVRQRANVQIDLFSTVILSNHAGDQGGGISTSDSEYVQIALTNVTFRRNSCERKGGGAAISSGLLQCMNCDVADNVAPYASGFMSTNLRLEISTGYTQGTMQGSSGEVLSLLTVNVVDDYLNSVKETYFPVLTVQSNASEVIGNQAHILRGTAAFDALTVRETPGSSVELHISWSPDYDDSISHPVQHYRFPVHLRQCVTPEGLSEDLLSCEDCGESNGYSIDPDEPCQYCARDEVVSGTTCNPLEKDGLSETTLMFITITGSLVGTALLLFSLRVAWQQIQLKRMIRLQKRQKEASERRALLAQIQLQNSQLQSQKREYSIKKKHQEFIDHQVKNKFAAVWFFMDTLLPLTAIQSPRMRSKQGKQLMESTGMDSISGGYDKSGTLDVLLDVDEDTKEMLLKCKTEMADGLKMCYEQHITNEITEGRYSRQVVPCDLRDLLEITCAHEIMHWWVDEDVPTRIETDVGLVSAILKIAYNNAVRFGGPELPTLSCHMVKHDGISSKKLELSLFNSLEHGKSFDQLGSQLPDIAITHESFTSVQDMAALINAQTDCQVDENGIRFSLIIDTQECKKSGGHDNTLKASMKSHSPLLKAWTNLGSHEPFKIKRDAADTLAPASLIGDDKQEDGLAQARCASTSTVGGHVIHYDTALVMPAASPVVDGAKLLVAPTSMESNDDGGDELTSSIESHTCGEANDPPMDISATISRELPEGLIYAVAEDNALMRAMLKKYIMNKLKGSSNSLFAGESKEEILNFVNHVLSMNPLPDIIILDQKLDDPRKIGGPSVMLGTDIIWMLKSREYPGVLIIRSANDSQADIDHYLESGVDGILKKRYTGPETTACLAEIWFNKHPVE